MQANNQTLKAEGEGKKKKNSENEAAKMMVEKIRSFADQEKSITILRIPFFNIRLRKFFHV